MTEDLYKKAEKRADAKLGFYHHLYGFITGNVILFVLNAITSFGNWFSPGNWWFLYITALWGIGLIIHFLKVFVFSAKLDDDYRDQMIEKEMEKMKK